MNNREKILKNVKRVVVKIGTKSLTNDIELDRKKIKKITDEISHLIKTGYQVSLVSSGAVSAGIGKLKLNRKPKSIPEKQASASIGQINLMYLYNYYFSKNNIIIGQILLTESDLKNRIKYLNITNTLNTLLEEYNALPIINENDVVGIDELIFGDNDELSALIANLVRADLLILLTDTDGFYLNNNGEQVLLKEVKKINQQITASAGGAGSKFSSGGMVSKIKAAKIATHSGIPVVIANSKKKDILLRILNGESEGTLFYPSEKSLSQRKRWLAFSVAPKGDIIIDNGARTAILNKGKSLLPGGIVKVKGKFAKGDPVNILDESNKIIARGLSNFNSIVLNKIKGKKTSEVKKIITNSFYEEVVNRDNLVILPG